MLTRYAGPKIVQVSKFSSFNVPFLLRLSKTLPLLFLPLLSHPREIERFPQYFKSINMGRIPHRIVSRHLSDRCSYIKDAGGPVIRGNCPLG